MADFKDNDEARKEALVSFPFHPLFRLTVSHQQLFLSNQSDLRAFEENDEKERKTHFDHLKTGERSAYKSSRKARLEQYERETAMLQFAASTSEMVKPTISQTSLTSEQPLIRPSASSNSVGTAPGALSAVGSVASAGSADSATASLTSADERPLKARRAEAIGRMRLYWTMQGEGSILVCLLC